MEIENKMFLIPEAFIKCSSSHVYTSLVRFRDFAKNEDTTDKQVVAAYSLGRNTWRYKILFNWNCVKGSEINAKWKENLSQEDLRLSLMTGKELLRKRHLNWDEVGGPERESGRELLKGLQAVSQGCSCAQSLSPVWLSRPHGL